MHEPDTTGRHVSLFLQILPFSFTDNTCDRLDREYESNTAAAAAEPESVLAQRGVKNATHASRHDMYVQ